jgi:tetratricopeptide (TPR) repeat protein
MRQKNWPLALRYFQQAEALAPQVTGIRLNIGLARYRQGDYAEAIPAFESVMREQPDSAQARRLLGLCYLFEERYADAAATLEPLWPASNRDLSYLYSLAVAAGNAGRHDLEQRSLAQLLEAGQNAPLVHLLVGKAYLAREDFDQALSELQIALKADPKLPLLHYTLGVVYRRKGDLEMALSAFQDDVAIEPEVAYNYDQLGMVSYSLKRNRAAESYFLKALKHDRKLASSWFGLAKIYKQEKQNSRALEALAEAGSIDPNSASVHYLRAQILAERGQKDQARAEMAIVRRLKIERVDKLEREVSGATYRDPQLADEPK